PLGEGLPLDELEDEAGDPGAQLEAVDGGHVRMVEGRQEPRLALDALARGLVAERLRERLDRDLAPEDGIEGPVDAPGAPDAEQAPQLVAAQARAGARRARSIFDLREVPEERLAPVARSVGQQRAEAWLQRVVLGAEIGEPPLPLGGGEIE